MSQRERMMDPRVKKAVRYLSLRLRLHGITNSVKPVHVRNACPRVKFITTVASLHITETMALLRDQHVAFEVKAA